MDLKGRLGVRTEVLRCVWHAGKEGGVQSKGTSVPCISFQITKESGFRSEATLSGIFSECAMSRDCTHGCEVGLQELTMGGYLDGSDYT